MNVKQTAQLFFLSFTFFIPFCVGAQITSNSDGMATTEYSSGTQDNIYLFCSAPNQSIGELTATASNGAASSFEWLKYNSTNGSFDPFSTDNSGNTSSTVSNLTDGGYRVNVTANGVTETYTAWVFNSWYTATAEITESTCDYFQLTASFEQAQLTYYDLSSGSSKQVAKDVRVKWSADGEQISTVISPTIYSPPAKDTDYTLTVYDQFGCMVEVTVNYQSVVTQASFTASPMNGEAPLEVNFMNSSLNADQYEWFFFRDRDELVREGENGTVEDSIMLTAIDENPIITYDKSGTYQVKLVTTKNSADFACTDTFYLSDYIVADTSFIKAPNVFTPNGDGANDAFVISYWSLKSLKIQIFNRWGRKVHVWENNNVQGFEGTRSESAWDGKIGGKYASPGVYYYVVEALGRDDKKRFAHGFVHLFREK